jgi:hypothetical protein
MLKLQNPKPAGKAIELLPDAYHTNRGKIELPKAGYDLPRTTAGSGPTVGALHTNPTLFTVARLKQHGW